MERLDQLPVEAKKASSDLSSSNTTDTVIKKGGNKNKMVKEYNLREKPLAYSSPIHGNSIIVTSVTDTGALAAMHSVASRNWADLCEEEDNRPKYGSGRKSQ